MRKSWIILLLTPPLMSLATTYPIYDEEYQTSYELELDSREEAMASEPSSGYWEEEEGMIQSVEEESFVYENEMEEERYVVPQKRRRHLNDLTLGQKRENASSRVKAGSPQRKQSISSQGAAKNPRSSIRKNTAARSKIKDARDNTNRPRVIHRNQRPNPNVEQIEADAYNEEPSFNDEVSTSRTYRSSKAAQSQAYVEKKGERGSSFNQREMRSKTPRRTIKKSEHRTKSYHPGKRPITEQ